MKKACLSVQMLCASTLLLVAQPVITQSPVGQLVTNGGTISLSVTATGSSLAYQWIKDDSLIVGATNSSLTITNARLIHSGAYNVVITNSGGMVLSVPVMVLVENPNLLGWGYNGTGELGKGNYMNTNQPIFISSPVATVAAGGNHTLFTDSNGTLWGMGLNNFGQLGNGVISSTNLPIPVFSNVVAVAGGQYHTLFITSDGTLRSMGWNNFGQLGIGNNVDQSTPTIVASNVVAIAAGANHSMFIKADGTLWDCGFNFFGQLGNGTTDSTNLPIMIATNVVAAAAGYGHSLFLKSDRTLWAMGYNFNGQLGCGTLNDSNSPVLVATDVISASAGYSHSLFVTASRVLWAMGNNLNGQMGNGINSITNPVPIQITSNVLAATGGNSHSLYETTDGKLWSMGYNLYGQLGVGNNTDSPFPKNIPSLTVGSLFRGSLAQFSLATGMILSNATITLGNLYQVFTGNAASVSVTTIPSGLPATLTYNGLNTAPTNIGSYTVVGNINSPGFYGSVTNTLVIGLPPQAFKANLINTNQWLSLSLTGTPNYPYFLQRTTNLSPPIVWQSIITNPADLSGNWTLTITNIIPECFYRAGAY